MRSWHLHYKFPRVVVDETENLPNFLVQTEADSKKGDHKRVLLRLRKKKHKKWHRIDRTMVATAFIMVPEISLGLLILTPKSRVNLRCNYIAETEINRDRLG